MAATLKFSRQFIEAHPFPKMVAQYTTLTAGAIENLAHGGKAHAVVKSVKATPVVQATTGDPLSFSWIKASDSTANDTVCVVFDTIPGGDLTGMEVELEVQFLHVGSEHDIDPFTA